MNREIIACLGLALCACDDDTPTADASVWLPDIDAREFGPNIDNPLLPYPIGWTWTYEAETDEGLERIVVQALPDTQTVMGIQTRVVRDTVTLDGELVEDTYDWFAQHVDGTVWYFGEATAEYEDGVVVTTEGSWEAGVDGARPGIVMPATPVPGESYYQEYFPGEAEDQATVVGVDQQVELTYGSFDGCVRTHDFTALEPGVSEFKTYCPDVGLVLAEQQDAREELVALDRDAD